MKAVYSHIRFIEECENEEQAKAFVLLWETMIQALAVAHPVYIRRVPMYQSNRDFDSNREKWQASVRVSIGLASNHEPGVIKTMVYDNAQEFTGFGLTNALR